MSLNARELLMGDGTTSMVFPALVTPLTEDGAVDEPSTRRLIKHLYTQGIGGLYLCGSTGEGLYLDSKTRQRITEIAVEESQGKGKVIVHVGASADQVALDLGRHAAAVGVDMISSLPKFVGGGHTFDDIVKFYELLAQTSGLPVLVYHIPQVTGQKWSYHQLNTLLRINGVAGLKFSALDIFNIQRLKAMGALDATQVVFSGPDQMFVFGLQLQADGGIGTSYNFLSNYFVEVEKLVRAGDLVAAVKVQEQINEICEIYKDYKNQMAACKLILFWQGLIDNPRKASAVNNLMPEEHAQDMEARLRKTALGATFVKSSEDLYHPPSN